MNSVNHLHFCPTCQNTNCIEVQKGIISNNYITTRRRLHTHLHVRASIYTWICNYILNRFPFRISLLGLQLYLTQIRCYQNRLKWCVWRWQEMVEVMTSQRPLCNHPGELPQCMTELQGMSARKTVWKMRCSAMNPSWPQTSLHIKKCSCLCSLLAWLRNRCLEAHACFYMDSVQPLGHDSAQPVSITEANNEMKNHITSV